jgi:cytochrome c peroxidase
MDRAHGASHVPPRSLRIALTAGASALWLLSSGCGPMPGEATTTASLGPQAPAAAPGAPSATVSPAADPGPPPSWKEPVRDGQHGAMKMDQQLANLARLQGAAPNLGIPGGVDPGFWKALMPADNQLDAKRVELGRKLYFDTRLSKDGTVACATCHDVSRGFTDRRNGSEGINGKVGRRNAPTTLNAVFFSSQFWDGRAKSLEDQAKLPITNPIEMGQPDGASAVKGIANDAEYKAMFKAAYGKEPNFDDLARAIASFERTLVFIDAPFDRFVAGDPAAISDDAKAGWGLFNGKARCVACHQFNGSNPTGTNHRFHNIGVSARTKDFVKLAQTALDALAKSDTAETIDRLALETDMSELGRFTVTRNRADIGAFRTQQMRNVGITGPYMHDGSLQTLWDVMDHYNKGGEVSPYLDGGIEPLALTEREIDQVVAFMFSLTDVRFAEQNAAELYRQRTIARDKRPFRDNNLAERKTLPFDPRTEKGK